MDNIYFSYSSLTTFENCKYCYRLSYIDKKEPKENNFFGEYGLLVHDTIEQYFNGTLESYELSDYFTRKYKEVMLTPPPPFPAGMEEKYIVQGVEFFNTFYFEKEKYRILEVESELDFEISGITMKGRPDLILYDINKKENILLDYKTAFPFWNDKRTKKEKVDKKKIDGYFTQMYLYCYGIKQCKNLQIDKIILWFPRAKREIERYWEEEEQNNAIHWAKNIIENIKNEKEFRFNNSNTYFCNFLCGVRNYCEYTPTMNY